MIAVQVNISGANIPESVRLFVLNHTETSKLRAQNLFKQSLDFMLKYIDMRRKRPKGFHSRLQFWIEKSSKYFSTPTTFGFYIGDISIMNSQAKYWRAVNYGSYEIVGKEYWGHFEPGEPKPSQAHFREGRFYTNSDPKYKMTPKNPIPPMNFIENTMNYVNSNISMRAGRIM